MKIVADKDLFQVQTLFSELGELVLIPGREIKNHHLLRADALIVRSTTIVSEQLLVGTSLKFIGSATSGTDHIHLDFLNEKNIAFANARGCNVNAVTDYCLAAISAIQGDKIFDKGEPKVGIIGNGMIGSQLARKIRSLNWTVLVNDPPQRNLKLSATNDVTYYSLNELTECNIISLHVPLVLSGAHSTKNLIGKEFLCSLPESTILINTSRGGVVDEDALLEVMLERKDLILVMDVWKNEPRCNESLIDLAYIATPHIAGYSNKAKENASQQMLAALAGFFGLQTCSPKYLDSDISSPLILNDIEDHVSAIRKVFPIKDVSTRFKNSRSGKEACNENESFDNLRKELNKRQEFCMYSMPKSISEESVRFLTAAGFQN